MFTSRVTPRVARGGELTPKRMRSGGTSAARFVVSGHHVPTHDSPLPTHHGDVVRHHSPTRQPATGRHSPLRRELWRARWRGRGEPVRASGGESARRTRRRSRSTRRVRNGVRHGARGSDRRERSAAWRRPRNEHRNEHRCRHRKRRARGVARDRRSGGERDRRPACAMRTAGRPASAARHDGRAARQQVSDAARVDRCLTTDGPGKEAVRLHRYERAPSSARAAWCSGRRKRDSHCPVRTRCRVPPAAEHAWGHSSRAEHPAVDRKVAGASPAGLVSAHHFVR